VEGIQFLADLKHKWAVVPTDAARPTGPQGRPFFESGRLAFHPSGSFYYAQIKERASFRWGVAPIPHGRAGITPGTNAWLVGIGAGSKYQEAAWAFIAFYLQPENSAEFLRFVSWMPPIKAIERPPLVEDPNHWAAMTAAARAARALPTIPQMDEVLALVRQGLAAVFDAGTSTARPAVGELCPRVDALLAAVRLPGLLRICGQGLRRSDQHHPARTCGAPAALAPASVAQPGSLREATGLRR